MQQHPATTQLARPFTLEPCDDGNHACFSQLLIMSKESVVNGRKFAEMVVMDDPNEAQAIAIHLTHCNDDTIIALGLKDESLSMN